MAEHNFSFVSVNTTSISETADALEQLNNLHGQLKRSPNTDLELLEEIKIVLESFKYIHPPQPIEIAFGLVVKDDAYVESFRKYWNLLLQKFHATQQGKFEEAAKFRDSARREIETAMSQLLQKLFTHQGPFYQYQGRVFYHKLDSRVEGLL